MELNFYISSQLADTLFDLKEAQGRDDLTANEYAKELLENMIYMLERDIKRGGGNK